MASCGGPPPHIHTREDETFFAVEGDYELLVGDEWLPLASGQAIEARRGVPHTFRNVGQTTGKMLIFVTPAGMDQYLEEISKLRMPQDEAELIAISHRYGVSFLGH